MEAVNDKMSVLRIASSVSLEDLPTELVHRIASYCDIPDIHALSRVSRALHTSCSSPFVFQAHFCRHGPDPASDSVSDKHTLARSINAALTAAYPATDPGRPRPEARKIWSHLAATAPMLAALSDELDDLMLPYRAVSFQPAGHVKFPTAELLQNTRSLVGTFATFAVLGYTSVIDLGVAAAIPGLLIALTDAHKWSIHVYTEKDMDHLVRQQAFCLALGLLQSQVLNNMGVMTYHLSNMATWNEERTAFFRFKESWEGRQTIALLAQAMMAHLLRSSLSGRAVSEFLPAPERMPLAVFQGSETVLPLPLPVTPDGVRRRISAFSSTESWDRWNRAYVSHLAKEMDKGEWFGYFTWDTARNETTFLENGPIENIHFKVSETAIHDDKAEGGVFEVRAGDCKEPAGTFVFEGEFREKPQSVVLRKIHPDGHSYNFRGWFTPLGIAGTLDPSPWGMPGWFWLWKREWMGQGQVGSGAGQTASTQE